MGRWVLRSQLFEYPVKKKNVLIEILFSFMISINLKNTSSQVYVVVFFVTNVQI